MELLSRYIAANHAPGAGSAIPWASPCRFAAIHSIVGGWCRYLFVAHEPISTRDQRNGCLRAG